MKLTRKKVGYGVVLGGAVLALAYNLLADITPVRVVPHAPTAAAKSTGVSDKTFTPIVSAASLETSSKIASRLRAAAGSLNNSDLSVDGFAIPVELQNSPASLQSTATVAAAKHFQDTHKLKAILAHGPQSSILIDDRLLRLGQSLDGLKLIVVADRSATFAAGDKSVVLSLADADSHENADESGR